jgi:hypothetical protein
VSASKVEAKSPVPATAIVRSSSEAVVISVDAPEKVKPVDPMVLLVNVSVPAKVAKVPLVGNVTLVAPLDVKVIAEAPEVAKLPAKVKVPVVQVGAPAPPDNKACPAVPTDDASKLSASE